jgi:hypothetical protein
MKYLSKHSLITLGVGLSLAACAAEADEDGASASAPGVNAQAGERGVSASAPGVSAQANANGASAQAGPVDVTTAQLALDELSGNVDVSVDGFKTSAPPPPDAQPTVDPNGAAQSVSVTCASGGGADLDGYVNVVPVPILVDVKVAIAFNNCETSSGSTINGNIEFSQTVVSTPATPLQIETIYQGDVTLAGRVNVSCPVDINVLVDETGRAVKVQGSFCNQDASKLNLQLQPRWQAQ